MWLGCMATAPMEICGKSGPSPRPSPRRGEGAKSIAYERRSTISFLISAIALAGLSPFGQVRAQFMMVWQR